MKRIYFTVTNDLVYDQRMHRICTSLATNGYDVTLLGRSKKNSPPLQNEVFNQRRIICLFQKGILFYIEFNLRLFFYLLFKRMDGICAIDLDTILPCLFISQIKDIERIYDAHEYFTEMKELQRRKKIQKVWLTIEQYSLPKFKHCYTVSDGLATIFNKQYNKNFISIRNISQLQTLNNKTADTEFLLYQGAVNEGRGLEYLIPAMQYVPLPLVICGDGNYMSETKALINKYGLQKKVVLKGMILPDALKEITSKATLGINLTEIEGHHHYYALPNKFFDYIHACVPQISMNLPEYRKINERFEVAVLIDDLNSNTIATAINNTLYNRALLKVLKLNCLKAREVYNWELEEEKLLLFYQNVFR